MEIDYMRDDVILVPRDLLKSASFLLITWSATISVQSQWSKIFNVFSCGDEPFTMNRVRLRWLLNRAAFIMSIFVIVLICGRYFLFSGKSGKCIYKDTIKLTNDLKGLVRELSETRRDLNRSLLHYHRIGQHIESLSTIIISLGGSPAGLFSSENAPPKKEVCPEKFMGYSWPFFRKGFKRVNCTEFVPLNQLITLLVVLPHELSAKEQLNFFQGLQKYHPQINIVLASKEELQRESIKKIKLNFKNIVFKDLYCGKTWNSLLQEVTTPYVLLAPDATHFNDDIDLERLVRVLSENEDAIIAGGSHRNQEGEWDIGCLQVTFKNWTAYFRGGYYQSYRNECIICDVLSGPFMAKTENLKEIGIDKNLAYGVFQDIFWRLKTKHPEKVVVSCPDVMFYKYSREIPDENYVDLTRKWNVKKWVESSGRVRWYGCRHGYSHTSPGNCDSFQSGMAVPPCDLENLADAVKFVMKECENAGLLCELTDGTLTGAVKFNKVLPWERDADITFLSANYSAFKQLESKFTAAGFRVESNDKALKCCVDGRQSGGTFDLFTTHWKLELWGQYKVDSEDLIASGLKPTKIQFAGQWVNVNRNPGLFVRNRYGFNVYQHAEHWSDLGRKSSWEFYRPNLYRKCPRPGHSACLDQYPVDGNLQFSDYPQI